MLCVVFAFLGAGVIYGLTDVNNDLTPEDVQAINSLGVSGECHGLHDFPAELGCIRSVQLSIKTHVSDMRCADKSQIIEPDQFLARGYGCCFDRARFIEKTLQFYGFQTRHLALHHLTIPVLGYLLPVNSSHSTSEVLTSKGWMYVDSNSLFVLISNTDEPLTAIMLRQIDWGELKQRPVPEEFFSHNPTIFYGLYSRHGYFYPPKIPLPDIDWSQLNFNFQ